MRRLAIRRLAVRIRSKRNLKAMRPLAIALRGDWDAQLVATGLGVALLFGVGSRFAWRASLARYTSASS
jgi:ABC-type uncharacterized transport system permease subunit